MKRLVVHLHKVPTVVAACCTLHTICEVHGDEFDQQWLEEPSNHQLPQPDNPTVHAIDHADSSDVRDLFVTYAHIHQL